MSDLALPDVNQYFDEIRKHKNIILCGCGIGSLLCDYHVRYKAYA